MTYDLNNTAQKSTRAGLGEAVLRAGETNSSIVALTADLAESTQLSLFGKKFPDRFFDVGVAEQNMAGISAGLALSGKIPFMGSFGVFNPGRNWDQIRVSICYTGANVKIVGSHSGFSNGPDGATHQALEDIALTRVLPNMHVFYPADYNQARQCVTRAIEIEGPVYIRTVREKTPVFTDEGAQINLGKIQTLLEGADLTVVSAGPLLFTVLKVAEELKTEKNLHVEVLNAWCIKPFDHETLIKSAKKTKKVMVVEEHQVAGGLGGLVSEVLSENYPVIVKKIGANDTFGESGTYEDLLTKYGLSEETIKKEMLRLISSKS